MTGDLKCLGSTKISSKLRISISKDAAAKLDVKTGDILLYYEDEAGNILIKKA